MLTLWNDANANGSPFDELDVMMCAGYDLTPSNKDADVLAFSLGLIATLPSTAHRIGLQVCEHDAIRLRTATLVPLMLNKNPDVVEPFLRPQQQQQGGCTMLYTLQDEWISWLLDEHVLKSAEAVDEHLATFVQLFDGSASPYALTLEPVQYKRLKQMDTDASRQMMELAMMCL